MFVTLAFLCTLTVLVLLAVWYVWGWSAMAFLWCAAVLVLAGVMVTYRR